MFSHYALPNAAEEAQLGHDIENIVQDLRL